MTPEEVEVALRQVHRDCFGWALNCCGRDRTEAEDVLQSACLKILNGDASFREQSSFRTWVFGVIWRTAQESRRRNIVRQWLSLDWLRDTPAETDAARGPDDNLALTERNRKLVQALARLSKRQRDVLHLVFYQELTIHEAANVVGISLGSARTHYERGKARLRQLLEEEAGT